MKAIHDYHLIAELAFYDWLHNSVMIVLDIRVVSVIWIENTNDKRHWPLQGLKKANNCGYPVINRHPLGKIDPVHPRVCTVLNCSEERAAGQALGE